MSAEHLPRGFLCPSSRWGPLDPSAVRLSRDLWKTLPPRHPMSNFPTPSDWLPSPVIVRSGRQRSSGPVQVFFSEILKNSRNVGAVAPTSRRLARNLAAAAEVARAARIVELGAGTGAVTTEIVRAKSPSARLLVLERNPRFAEILREHFPDVPTVADCASRLPIHVARAGMSAPDCVVSSLPWTSFPSATQHDLLRMVADLLHPAGTFVTIACYGVHLTSSGRRFQSALHATFGEVVKTAATWSNFPPAFVYRCRRPRSK